MNPTSTKPVHAFDWDYFMPKAFEEFNNLFLELTTEKNFEYPAALEAPVSLERCKTESKSLRGRVSSGNANYYIALKGLGISGEKDPNQGIDPNSIVVLFGLTRYNQKAEFRISLLSGGNPTGSLGIEDFQIVKEKGRPPRTQNSLQQEALTMRTIEKLKKLRANFEASSQKSGLSVSLTKDISEPQENKENI